MSVIDVEDLVIDLEDIEDLVRLVTLFARFLTSRTLFKSSRT